MKHVTPYETVRNRLKPYQIVQDRVNRMKPYQQEQIGGISSTSFKYIM